jgi:2-dehydro-3-deoxyphosphogluconate aldolase/(4S)-4-hydroxy-2-oxoglutarate aldolase
MTREKVITNIREKKVVAIARGFKPKQCVELAGALYAGGINMIEVTFDQSRPDAYAETTEAIRAIRDHFAGEVIPGAGTVMTVEQVDLAKEAGAFYIISPDTNIEVIRYTRKVGLVSLPGAMTPTEAVSAYRAGADMIKLFPIANLGAAYLKALKAPLRHIDFMAVGGVSPENIHEFIKAGAAGAGVGGLLTKKELVEAGEFEKITELARRYVENANA